MPLYLTEDDVLGLITIDDAIEAVQAGFAAWARGEASNLPRQRVRLPNGEFNMMSAAAPGLGVMGLKAYGGGSRSGFHVQLSSTDTGELLAIIEASRLGQLRTGAASGLATRHMARADASTVGVLGAGYQARTQLEAVARVRRITSAKVFSPTQRRRQSYASEMSTCLGFEVTPVETAESCVRGSDIVIVVTNASTPVLNGSWLESGTHVNAAGANSHRRRELDDDAVKKASIVVVDDLDQARIECGDIIHAADLGVMRWEQVRSLAEVVGGVTPGRSSDEEITLFESQGVALEDVALAATAHQMALERGVGETF